MIEQSKIFNPNSKLLINDRMNSQTFNKSHMMLKNSICSLGSAANVQSIISKKNKSETKKLESITVIETDKSLKNTQWIKKQIQRSFETSSGFKSSNRGEQNCKQIYSLKNEVQYKIGRHGRNISAIWRNKRKIATKEKSASKSDHNPYMKSSIQFPWQRRKNSEEVELKMAVDVKKVESVPRYHDNKQSYSNPRFRRKQSHAFQERKKDLQKIDLPHYHKANKLPDQRINSESLCDKPLVLQRSQPINYRKQGNANLQSIIWAQAKAKRNFPKKLQPPGLYHTKRLLSLPPEELHEDKIQIIKKDQNKCIYYEESEEHHNFESLLKQKSAVCLEVSHFSESQSKLRQIFSRQPQRRVQIASITKIMTCYLVLKISYFFEIDIYKEKTLVSEKASRTQGTSANLQYSDTLTIFQLLYALMLPSGNDAAVALAEWGGKTIRKYCQLTEKYMETKKQTGVGKSINFVAQLMVEKKTFFRLFVWHMNKAARSLGLKNTNFANPHGLMNRQAFSTARDVSILTSIAMQDKIFRKIVKSKEFCCQVYNRTYTQTKEMHWFNTNKLLNYDGFIGVKTGVTPAAGPCLSSVFEIKKGQIIVITVLKVKSMNDRFNQSLGLLALCLNLICPEKAEKIIEGMKLGSEESEKRISLGRGEEANLAMNSERKNESDSDYDDESDFD